MATSAVEEQLKLNSREVTILQYLADGMNMRQVGETLRLSYQVVKNYTGHIREKLDSHTTENAIAIAMRRGIIQ